MAVQNQPDNYNTLSPLSFRLVIDQFPLLTFWCQSANIPGITVTESTSPNPLRDIPMMGDKVEYETLDVTMIVDEDLANYREILEWIRGQSPDQKQTDHKEYLEQNPRRRQLPFSSTYERYLSDAVLHITTNSKGSNKTVTFKDIFPVSLGALAFDSTAELAPITTDISFQIRDYIIDG